MKNMMTAQQKTEKKKYLQKNCKNKYKVDAKDYLGEKKASRKKFTSESTRERKGGKK